MNNLVEAINYSSDTYWGDPERFKFNAQVNNFGNITEINQGDNRIVKTNFTIDLQGYLVPKSINKELVKQPQKFFSKSTVIFNNELSLVKLGGPPLDSGRRDERVPQDRGEVRALADGLDIQQLIEGIGFMAIEDDFIIF